MSGPTPPTIPAPNLPQPLRPTTSDLPTKGIAFSIMGSFLLTLNDTIAKFLTADWPVGEIMALRGTVILFVIIGLLQLKGRMSALRIQNKTAMGVRALAITAATFTFLTALSLMPMADALAIVFISPVFSTLLAIVILQETVGWRRWIAMAVGFAGVFIALNPGGLLSDAPAAYGWQVAMLPLVTALLTAIRDVSSRRLVSGDDSLAIMFYTVLAVVISGYTTVTAGSWQMPGLFDIALILGAAAFMFGAYFFQIESFRFAPVNLVAPFRYISLIFAAGMGYAIWNDIPTWNMALGSIIIVASGLVIWWRERQGAANPTEAEKMEPRP
ncbi:DMT family transporter [Hwanghaeella sp. LZ110]|jgi:drug/metabolite transporter (DMT)-like permease|uniref:DMT family transporter n=1 Tax=Hwanghaeella sp. LZ110 TaxID=3402810 RepID=UPI003B6716E3